ncbi:MAG: O-antigen ligase family protein [Candidatus Delongbacteria bacterium]
MKVLAALLTITALVGALVLNLAYLYPILGALLLGLFILLKLDHLFLGLLLAAEGFVFGALGYGANTLLGLRVGYSDLLLLGLAIAALIRMAINRDPPEGQSRTLVLFFVWMLLFAVNVAVHPDVMEAGLSKFQLFCVDPFLIFLVGTRSLDRRDRLETALIALALVALPLGLMVAKNWVAAGLRSDDAVLDANTLREATLDTTFMFSNKNISASMFAALTPLFLGAAGALRSTLGRIVCGLAAATGAAVVFLALSRGSLVALAVGLLVYGGLGLRSRKTFAIVGVVSAAVLTAVLAQVGLLEPILARFQESTDFNRLELLRSSLSMLADYPLTGIGMSEFSFLEMLYFHSQSDVNLVHPHNSFLQMAVFGGIPLFLAFFGVLVSALWGGKREPAEDPDWRRMQVASLASVVVFLVNMLTDFIYFNSISCFTFWILVSVYASSGLWVKQQTESSAT